MAESPHSPDIDLEHARSDVRYGELIDQSAEARRQGNHWAAQKYATAAHKWALEERTRIKRLEQARTALTSATRQLNAAWDKDRECETIEELREQHPEFKRVITVWEEAEAQVTSLENPPPPEEKS
jgi:hypothetical protein